MFVRHKVVNVRAVKMIRMRLVTVPRVLDRLPSVTGGVQGEGFPNGGRVNGHVSGDQSMYH